jgi:hypothetical protein
LSALNKYWRALPEDEYLHKMDIPDTNCAIQVSSFPKEIAEWIWEEEKKEGAHFTKTVREY